MRFSWTKRWARASPPSSSPRIASSHPHVPEADLGVVGRHVEGPPVELDLEPLGASRGTMNAVMPRGLARRARGAGEDEVVAGAVHPRVEALGAVDHPFLALPAGDRLQVGRIGAVVGLGEPEGEPHLPAQRRLQQGLLLRRRPELVQQDHGGEVADHRGLALGVVVQPDAEPVEVLAHDRELVGSSPRGRRARRAARSATGPRDRRAGPSRSSRSSHSRLGIPPCSKSVRACSRRWSKKRALSSCASSGRTSPLDEAVDLLDQGRRLWRQLFVHRSSVAGSVCFR